MFLHQFIWWTKWNFVLSLTKWQIDFSSIWVTSFWPKKMRISETRFDINKEDKINGGLVLSVFVCVFKMGHIRWLLHWKNLFWSWQHERDGRWWGLKETTRVRSLIGNWWPQRDFLIFSKFKSSSSTVAGPLFLLGQATTRKADTVNKVLARGEWIVSAYFSSQQD